MGVKGDTVVINRGSINSSKKGQSFAFSRNNQFIGMATVAEVYENQSVLYIDRTYDQYDIDGKVILEVLWLQSARRTKIDRAGTVSNTMNRFGQIFFSEIICLKIAMFVYESTGIGQFTCCSRIDLTIGICSKQLSS